MRANEAKVQWNAARKRWQVTIQAGAEVIHRPCPTGSRQAADADLRSLAAQVAKEEGYGVDEDAVSIVR